MLAEAHDGGAHRGRAERDDEAEQQKPKRRRRRAVSENQIAQSVRIERQQPAQHQDGSGHARGEVDEQEAKGSGQLSVCEVIYSLRDAIG